MAGWKKYFKTSNLPSNISPLGGGRAPDPGMRNYQSQLPECILVTQIVLNVIINMNKWIWIVK